MPKYRYDLPQLGKRTFLTDSGLETTLVFLEGVDLPCFASFPLLADATGRRTISDYYERHARIAVEKGFGFILEAVTWRANPDWAAKLGYSGAALDAVNRDAIALLQAIRLRFETPESPMVISGNLGPRGDGYDAGKICSADEYLAYHARQIEVFTESEADMVAAFTMTNVNEALGITRAAQAARIPVAISFTVETDGRLPSGQTLRAAIEEVDAATDSGPAYYMVNCAHPSHFDGVLDGAWTRRIRGLRANASTLSHAELDAATELDSGDPADLGKRYGVLRSRLPEITIVGGCCGTDHRHVEHIAHAYAKAA